MIFTEFPNLLLYQECHSQVSGDNLHLTCLVVQALPVEHLYKMDNEETIHEVKLELQWKFVGTNSFPASLCTNWPPGTAARRQTGSAESRTRFPPRPPWSHYPIRTQWSEPRWNVKNWTSNVIKKNRKNHANSESVVLSCTQSSEWKHTRRTICAQRCLLQGVLRPVWT